MKLTSAAKHFDKLVISDAYTPATTFKGQIVPYDDSTRDGATVVRRILSVAPTVAIPARGSITFGGQQWLVGALAPDYFNNTAIRHKYPIHRCDGLATIKTIQQALQNSSGSTAYSSLLWVKAAKEVEVSSGEFDVLNMYFSTYETITERTLVSLGSRWYLIRTSYVSSAGFRVAVVDELPEPVLETVTLQSRTFNPITETYSSTPTYAAAIRLRWQSSFEYLSAASETYQRGDLQLMLLKTVTPKVQDALTLSDGNWRVLSVLDEGTHWSAHLRRA